jgi:hypothetical protein
VAEPVIVSKIVGFSCRRNIRVEKLGLRGLRNAREAVGMTAGPETRTIRVSAAGSWLARNFLVSATFLLMLRFDGAALFVDLFGLVLDLIALLVDFVRLALEGYTALLFGASLLFLAGISQCAAVGALQSFALGLDGLGLPAERYLLGFQLLGLLVKRLLFRLQLFLLGFETLAGALVYGRCAGMLTGLPSRLMVGNAANGNLCECCVSKRECQ